MSSPTRPLEDGQGTARREDLSPSVLVVGDVNVDLSFRPDATTTATNAPIQVQRGGAAANTAVGLARQGLSAALLGMVGDDALGRLVRADLTREGVDVTHLVMHPTAGTQQVIYALDEGGRIVGNAVWPALGDSPLFQLRADHVPPGLLSGFDWLHVVGFTLIDPSLREAVMAIIVAASTASVPVSMDLNFRGLESADADEFRTTLDHALPYMSVVLGSARDEFAWLHPDLGPEEAAHAVARACGTAVVRLERDGALAISHGERVVVDGFDVVVRSSVGAGDAFNAGYLAASLRGAGTHQALARGNATAALLISREASLGPPTAEDVDSFLIEDRR